MPLATRATAVKYAVAVVALTIWLATPPVAPAAPVASFSFSPTAPLTGELVTFVSSSTGATQQRWALDDDRLCDDTSGATAQRSFPVAGRYRVTLCATDDNGDLATQTRTVTVHNRPPVAAFTFAPAEPVRGEPVILTSFSADPDGPLVSHAWDLDGDGAFDDGQASTASVTFPTTGDHTVQLLVTDRDGAANVAVHAIRVHQPVAQFITPFPVVRVVGAVGELGTRIKEIVIRVPEGSRVEIRCRGIGCPAARRSGGARLARTMHVRRFARRVLRPGAVLQIWVTKPAEIGKYTRFRIRKGKLPSRVDRCLRPGSKRPVRCGS